MSSNSRNCAAAYQRPEADRNTALLGCSIFAMAVFSCATLLFAYWLRYWYRLPVSVKHKLWSKLGWFAFLGFTGNVAGVVARAAYMQELQFYYIQDQNQTSLSPQQASSYMAASSLWRAVYWIAQGIETPCLSISKALVLSRLIAHASLPLQQQVLPPWEAFKPVLLRAIGRLLVTVAVVCSIICLVSNSVAAAREFGAASLYRAAAADGSGSFKTTFAAADASDDQAEVANAVHNVSELVSLLCIICTFAAVAPMCVRIMRTAERKIFDSITKSKLQVQPSQAAAQLMAQEMMDRAMQTAQLQRRLITAAASVVLIALLPRAGLVTLRAYMSFQNNQNNACDTCGICQTTQHLVKLWYLYTPELPVIISTMSSPVPLSVCLWCMLSPSDRFRLRNNVSGDGC